MSEPKRSPPPDDETLAPDPFEEKSAVRERYRPALAEPPQGRGIEANDAASSILRAQRLEMKLRLAAETARELPSEASEARLLEIAIVRRDEVLIDAILNALVTTNRFPQAAPRTPHQPGERRQTLLPPPPESERRKR
jgi:hypothetical protein